MLKFKQVELKDKPWIDKLTMEENLRSADFNFTNIYIWDEVYRQSVVQYEDRLLIRLDMHDTPYYAFPVGRGDLRSAILAIKEDADRLGARLHINGIVRERIDAIEALFPGKFRFVPVEYAWDYLYQIERLQTLAGKKLHGKRNHINRFLALNPEWSFEPVTADTIQECLDMDMDWISKNTDDLGNGFGDERVALEKAMANFDYLRLDGGILRLSGKIIAFSVGEKLNSDTYVIHFEKAYSGIQGSYAMINREFARYIGAKYPEIAYINREDDMGIEALKVSKRSYYPDMMVEKYSAHYVGEQ